MALFNLGGFFYFLIVRGPYDLRSIVGVIADWSETYWDWEDLDSVSEAGQDSRIQVHSDGGKNVFRDTGNNVARWNVSQNGRVQAHKRRPRVNDVIFLKSESSKVFLGTSR